MVHDEASGVTSWDDKDDLPKSCNSCNEGSELNLIANFEDEYLELAKIQPFSGIDEYDDENGCIAGAAVIEAQECSKTIILEGPSIPSDWPDNFGPGGEFGLGRNWYGECVRPPVTFVNLAARLTLQRRAMFFWTVVHDAFDIIPIADQFLAMQASIERTLSRYDGQNGDRLIEHLVQCSDRKFLRCLRAVMIDTGLPKDMYCMEEEDESLDQSVYQNDDGSPYLCTIPNIAFGCPKDGWVRTVESVSPSDLDWEISREVASASMSLVQKAREQLPLEIYEVLEEAYMAKFFGPRRRHFAPKNLKAPEQRLTNRAFNMAYQQTRRTHVRDNTWIIDGEDFMSILHSVSGWWNEDGGLRKVELVLSLRDLCQACLNKVHDELTPVGWEPVLWGQEQLEWDVLKVLDRHWYHCNLVYQDIIDEWLLRFNTLAAMPLEYMSIDFSEAHDLSGHFVGLEVARNFEGFKYGIPADFIVKAPTEELATEIKEIIIAPPGSTSAAQGGW